MLDATLRVRGCRGRVGDDGWVVGQKTLPSPKREKRFKNAVIKKKKSNTTRSHVNPTKSSGMSLAPAQTLTLAVSASEVSSGSHHSQMGSCPSWCLKDRESGGSGPAGEEAVGGSGGREGRRYLRLA